MSRILRTARETLRLSHDRRDRREDTTPAGRRGQAGASVMYAHTARGGIGLGMGR
ncbi:hypothetical protein JSY14_04815 [Brachybacterium sp. EF45031]|uniref:hypothetical protein n=1 Tax=Brachybacterium sillae TaxID=2810536 RepID=UPI00217D0D0F|nr:hypothetical protein [Brachybacterium sillae]MCS6711373.1 hypothetical protein [Brachybacterium sillae]